MRAGGMSEPLFPADLAVQPEYLGQFLGFLVPSYLSYVHWLLPGSRYYHHPSRGGPLSKSLADPPLLKSLASSQGVTTVGVDLGYQ
jgi:hypothetical protein